MTLNSRPRPISLEEAQEAYAEADPLRDHFVWWDDIKEEHVAALRSALERATTERDMQAFLEQNRRMLVQHLGGGHGRWVVPQPRLGSEHVPDFVIGDEDSNGRHWVAVELEGPQRPIFNKSGDPSRFSWHGVRQIIDWRVWLQFNRDYAVRPPSEQGLGLEDITSNVPGLLIIGRRRELDEERRAFRRELGRQLDIDIHTYDWLIDRAQGRVKELD